MKCLLVKLENEENPTKLQKGDKGSEVSQATLARRALRSNNMSASRAMTKAKRLLCASTKGSDMLTVDFHGGHPLLDTLKGKKEPKSQKAVKTEGATGKESNAHIDSTLAALLPQPDLAARSSGGGGGGSGSPDRKHLSWATAPLSNSMLRMLFARFSLKKTPGCRHW